MSLEAQITQDMKDAMRAKDKVALETIRAIKSAILLAKTETAGKESLSADEELKLLTKLKKQRQDSLSIYNEQGRADLAEAEQAQLAIIERYLPKQMDEAEIRKAVEIIVAQTGASGMQDMGKVMGMASKQMAGKADGKTISGIVKSLLS